MVDKQKEIKSRALTPEMLLNRQMNYTIFKMLWRLREDKSSMQEFYSQMGINRNRYRSIVTNDKARTPRLQEVATQLSKDSGVPIEVYMGNVTFTIHEISREEWEDYFIEMENALISDKEAGKRYSLEQCKGFERKLMILLKAIPVTRDVDEKLYSAYSYFVYGETVNSSEIQVKLKRLINQMRGLTFVQLESLDTKELEEYYSQLKKQAEMVSALYNFRKQKNI